jgi:hypothetical protein
MRSIVSNGWKQKVLEDFFFFPSWKTMQPLVLKIKYFLGDKITTC